MLSLLRSCLILVATIATATADLWDSTVGVPGRDYTYTGWLVNTPAHSSFPYDVKYQEGEFFRVRFRMLEEGGRFPDNAIQAWTIQLPTKEGPVHYSGGLGRWELNKFSSFCRPSGLADRFAYSVAVEGGFSAYDVTRVYLVICDDTQSHITDEDTLVPSELQSLNVGFMPEWDNVFTHAQGSYLNVAIASGSDPTNRLEDIWFKGVLSGFSEGPPKAFEQSANTLYGIDGSLFLGTLHEAGPGNEFEMLDAFITEDALWLPGNVEVYDASELDYFDKAGVYKVLHTGELDTSFAQNGLFTVNSGSQSESFLLNAYSAQDGGVFLLYEDFYTSQSHLLKLAPTGVPDPNFGVDGTILLEQEAETDFIALAELTDGSLVIATEFNHSFPRYNSIQVRKFSKSGSQDLTFGNAGLFEFGHNDTDPVNEILDFWLDEKRNRILVLTTPGSNDGSKIIAVSTDGALDSSFADQGVLLLPGVELEEPHYLLMDQEDKLLLLGEENNFDRTLGIMAFDSRGQRLSNYGDSGIRSITEIESDIYRPTLLPDASLMMTYVGDNSFLSLIAVDNVGGIIENSRITFDVEGDYNPMSRLLWAPNEGMYLVVDAEAPDAENYDRQVAGIHKYLSPFEEDFSIDLPELEAVSLSKTEYRSEAITLSDLGDGFWFPVSVTSGSLFVNNRKIHERVAWVTNGDRVQVAYNPQQDSNGVQLDVGGVFDDDYRIHIPASQWNWKLEGDANEPDDDKNNGPKPDDEKPKKKGGALGLSWLSFFVLLGLFRVSRSRG